MESNRCKFATIETWKLVIGVVMVTTAARPQLSQRESWVYIPICHINFGRVG